MVIIKDYKVIEKEDDTNFCMLILEGGLEVAKSNQTGKFYATKRTCSISSTFDEETCKGLIGQKMHGKIVKVESEPYDYEIPSTGETIQLNYSFEFDPNGEFNEEVLQNEMVS
ncbi:MAG: hypothetical protein R2730_12925 [Chitinophagales bacterium]